MKNAITDKSEEQKKWIFAEKESVLNNAVILHKKWNDLIDQFTKYNIISVEEKLSDPPKKITESIPGKKE